MIKANAYIVFKNGNIDKVIERMKQREGKAEGDSS